LLAGEDRLKEHTTGSRFFADGQLPSAKAIQSSAKALSTVFHVSVGKESVGKDGFADGHVSGRRQSFANGRASRR
jgi:hypothetical protein